MSTTLPLTAEEITAFVARLRSGATVSGGKVTDPGDLIDVIAELESLKNTAAGLQADAAAVFDALRRSEHAAEGVPAARQGRGVANEIALARHESPHRGRTLLGMAKVLTTEMPHTHARLIDGSLSEFRAMLLVRETACLALPDRQRIDQELCADPDTLTGLGTRHLLGRCRRLVVELDPAGAVRRASNAIRDRHVSIRPAPDTMTWVSALLPVAQGVAVHAALTRAADQARASGDPRSKGQVMADTLVHRITRSAAVPGEEPVVPVGVTITIPVTALAGGHDAAEIHANGTAPETLPAEIARTLIAAGLTDPATTAHCWYRRLFVDPAGRLVALTSRSRDFPPGLADFLDLRGGGICATPWCDAPIRHTDHIQPAHQGGPTSAINGQGLCEACNHAKQATGWTQRPQPDGTGQAVQTITPTGHHYQTRPPTPPGWRQPHYVLTQPGVYTLTA
ncbi:DUF222 domain-containing protein [Nocardioides sp. BGMRC 2183]|nr:DUF222 domain-containing protein [Nocardioides sp. BGMRC 2183]